MTSAAAMTHRFATIRFQRWACILAAGLLTVGGCAGPGLNPRQAITPTGAETATVIDRSNEETNPTVAPVGYLDAENAGQTAGYGPGWAGTAGPCPCGSPACGAASCGSSAAGFAGCLHGRCPPVQPHGYASQPTTFNLYGVDGQEFICDGGDQDPRAMLRQNDSIAGLEPQDTIVHYTTEAGDIEIVPSNRICLYAPRFGAVRKITGAMTGYRSLAAVGVDMPLGPNRVELNQPGLVLTDSAELGRAERYRGPDAMRDRNRGVPLEGVLQPEMAADVLTVVENLSVLEIQTLDGDLLALVERAALAAITLTGVESVEVAVQDLRPPVLTRDQRVEGLTIYEFPTGRLQIVKLADRHHAQPGELVTFALRVDNVGDAPVNHVVISDNLVTRLEYVPDSQTCSVEADFSTEPNTVGSQRLEWALQDELKVGESAMIRFQCRVR